MPAAASPARPALCGRRRARRPALPRVRAAGSSERWGRRTLGAERRSPAAHVRTPTGPTPHAARAACPGCPPPASWVNPTSWVANRPQAPSQFEAADPRSGRERAAECTGDCLPFRLRAVGAAHLDECPWSGADGKVGCNTDAGSGCLSRIHRRGANGHRVCGAVWSAAAGDARRLRWKRDAGSVQFSDWLGGSCSYRGGSGSACCQRSSDQEPVGHGRAQRNRCSPRPFVFDVDGRAERVDIRSVGCHL